MKLDKLHVALLAVAVLGLGFGLYAMFLRDTGGVPARPQIAAGNEPDAAPTNPAQELPATNEAGSPGKTQSRETPDDPNKSPAPRPHPKETSDNKPALRGDGVIEGVVLDTDGNPVSGARIGARAQAARERHVATSAGADEVLDDAALRRMAAAERNTWRTVSDDQGRFRFSELAGNSLYNVAADHDIWGVLDRNGVSTGEKLVFQYDVTAVTTGLAVDEHGQPISDVGVVNGGSRAFASAKPGPGDGRFVARWRDHVEFFRVVASGYVASQNFGREYQGKTDLRVTLLKAPRLEGVVETPAGLPVPRAKVSVASGTMDASIPAGFDGRVENQETTTDLQGRFWFLSLSPGEYTVTARQGQNASAGSKVDLRADASIRVTLDAGPMLRVRALSGEGKPVGGTWIGVRDLGGDWLDTEEFETGVPGETCVVALPRTVVQVQVRSPRHAQQWHEVDMSTGSQRLDVTLKPGAVVSGRVTDNAGNPLSQLFLKFVPPGGGEKGRWQMAYAENDARYKSEPLAPGDWTIEIYRDVTGRRLGVETLKVGDTDMQHDVRVSGLCAVTVKVVCESGLPEGWIQLWYHADGESEPSNEGIPASRLMQKNMTLAEGTYRFSASSDGLASRVVEHRVGAGVDNQITLTLAQPNALRFRWVDTGTDISRAGIKTGDIILEYDGRPVANKADLNKLIEASRDKDTVPCVLLRGTTRVEVNAPATPFLMWLEPAVR